MLPTSLAAVLFGTLANAAIVPTVTTDYTAAVARSAAEHKPLAVFVANGSVNDALAGKQFTPTEVSALSKQFITVFINAETPAGKELAQKFELSRGLVISDASGAKQALRHDGAVADSDLESYLVRFASAQAPATTEYHGLTAAPAPVYYPAPTFSTCPNGRCPNAR